jgi:hypothetical protein
MRQLLLWFGSLIVIGPIHMLEQVLFGLDELQELKGLMATYYGSFREADIATVTLVIIVFTIVQVLLYCVFAGGRLRLFVAGFFAVQAIGEVHHVLRVFASGTYNPGVVTSLAYMAIGVMLLRAVTQQWRETSQSRHTSPATV